MTVRNSGVRQKSSLHRFASFLPKDDERSIFLFLLFAPDTLCGESGFFTVYDTHNGGRQETGYIASGGFGVEDWN